MSEVRRSGYVALIGRPNVGKSTLMNNLLGQKISITADKPQTTRHRILGIKTENNCQALFVDTPGIHRLGKMRALNRYMNKAAFRVINDVEVVVFIMDALSWTADDDWVMEQLTKVKCPVILALNKVDRLRDKRQLLPLIEKCQQHFPFTAIIPISALKGNNVEQLETEVLKHLPEGPFYFPEDQITDRSEAFLIAEIIREKLTRALGQELPYALTVEIELFKREKGIIHISALIIVERASQKIIVIGDKGQQLKNVGSRARLDIQKLLGSKVFLQLWVKVKDSWSDDKRSLKSLGYEE